MAKALKPTTAKPSTTDRQGMKQTSNNDAFPVVRATRPVMPFDLTGLENKPPILGQTIPRHVNMMFAFGRQSLRGTVGYAPLGRSVPGRFNGEDDRAIITSLGGRKGY